MEEKKDNKSQNSVSDEKDINENKAIALLSYIGFLFLVPLLTKKDSKFCLFHAKQGLVIFIVEMVAWFFLSFWQIAFFGMLLNLGAFVLSIIGIINVLDGKTKKIPITGDLADKFNL